MANERRKRAASVEGSTPTSDPEPGSDTSSGETSTSGQYVRQVQDLLAVFVRVPDGQDSDSAARNVVETDLHSTARSEVKETVAQICRILQASGTLEDDSWIRKCASKVNLQETLSHITALHIIEKVLTFYQERDSGNLLQLQILPDPDESGNRSVEERWLYEASKRIGETIRAALSNNPAEPGATYRSLWKHLATQALLNASAPLAPAALELASGEQIRAAMERYLRDPQVLSSDIERFLYLQSSVLAQVYLEALNQSFDSLGIHLQDEPAPATPVLPSQEQYLTVMSSLPYQAIREALALNRFQRSTETPFPTAFLSKGSTQGHIQLRPPALDTDQQLLPSHEAEILIERMWQQQKELSDIDADALDALGAIWLAQARKAADDATADIDDLLRMRGLKPKRNGQGRRGGYEPEQRAAMQRALAHIQNLWLNMAEIEVYDSAPGRRRSKPVTQAIQSRAFTITDRMGQMRMDGTLDMQMFIFRPGKVFANFLTGPGRQTALLSAKALQYDLNNQRWEKRLTRYLSWQWRVRAHNMSYTQPYRVETLLEAVGETVDKRDPARTRNRLEKALDRLQADNVIAAWQYDRWNEAIAEQRGWAQKWLQATVLAEPPEVIHKQYYHLERHESLKRAELSAGQTGDAGRLLGKQVEQARQVRGLSQTQAAEQLGVTQGYLSKLEAGYAKPTKEVRDRIEAWLETG